MDSDQIEQYLEFLNGHVQGLMFAVAALMRHCPDPAAARAEVGVAIDTAHADALASHATTDGQLAGLLEVRKALGPIR